MFDLVIPRDRTWLRHLAVGLSILSLITLTVAFAEPKGEVYVPVETARGEVGYYIVSDGGSMPYRVKIRAPSFVNLQALEYACVGAQFADLITILATIDPVLGDVDR